MNRYCGIVLLLAAALPSWVAAQSAPKPPTDELPAVNTSGGITSTTAPAAPPRATSGGANSGGTTIIGERESPIGLYITPWRNASAEVDIDRPARLLSVQLEGLDRKVFSRQVEYYEALTAAQKAKTPPAPPARP
ncbi:hypothetical protein SAMN04488068_3293 [Hydrocarboniphaga daqingensis]|jgi:hypothetical protein|uniref:Uncharacterized protein n=1 Tax=Hydrocarboniphaga daqingensis TaxID=490188 RepID=A0A1M5S2E7_9GAMM|nr:hypothetical protein [Hydrocarboniphaga daqingensis]SHH32601.1 hypothetical protein SAMN04488068_3293 [Hydrocarboniphaga daqingensis]